MATMTGGRAVVEALIAQGVTTVFGIISVHNLHIFDALRGAEEQGRIRFVGGRHEHALAFMADGYARATGKPGVLVTSSGPGAADSVGGLGESFHSSIPILHVTTDIERDLVGKGKGSTHEAREQLRMFESVAGWTSLAASVADIPHQIAAAMNHLRTAHPRPAVVAVPTDLLAATADVEIIPPREAAPARASDTALAEAARLLAHAERPLVWAGNGVMMGDAGDELLRLAERLQVPIVAGDGGKGVAPEDHPLALGSGLGARLWGANPIHDYLPTCDAVLVAGASLPYRSTKGVGLRFPENLIHVDIDPGVFGRNYPAKVGLAGHVKAVLGQLLDAMPSSVARPAGYRMELQRLKGRIHAGVESQFPNELRLWEGIRKVIDKDAIVVVDSAMVGYAAQRCFTVYEPRSFHGPHGWVSVGHAFPASLGMKAAYPDRQVICVTGDGGFQYNMQELGTAIQHGLAPVVVLFNDNAWGALKWYQERQFDRRFFGVDLINPDFRKLAAAYEITATRVDTVEQLLWNLQGALTTDRIQLIEVMTPAGVAGLV